MQYVKHKYFRVVSLLLVLLAAVVLAAPAALAEPVCDEVIQAGCTETTCQSQAHGQWDPDAQVCVVSSDKAAASGNCSNLDKCDFIMRYLNPFIQLLSALVGVVVVISIVIGGIQYSSSAGDPQRAQAAKNRIRNAIIALITFIFLYALLNFLVPGGLFNK
jgi:hypothetical protein